MPPHWEQAGPRSRPCILAGSAGGVSVIASAAATVLPGWVLTSRDLPMAQGADLRMVNGDAAEVHGEAVEAAGEKNVWMVGGGNVASQWVEHGLIDELVVTLVPVILGEGLPLFASGILGEFRTKSVRPFASGMVELAYDFPR